VVVTPRSPSGITYSVLTSTGSALNAPASWATSDTITISGAEFLFGDVTGEGRDDAIAVTPRSPSGVTYNVLTSNGSAFAAPASWGSSDAGLATTSFDVADVNMDDQADVLAVARRRDGAPSGATYNVLTSSGSALSASSAWNTADEVDVASSRFATGDYTGDGRVDVLAITRRRDGSPSGASYGVLTSNGSALAAATAWATDDAVDLGSEG
jgi:hypothetical protein